MMIEFDSHTLWVKVKKQEGIGKMKFSLIIGTLNRCRELEICLESLRKQVFRDFEVIIIDQSINDSTQQLANGYQDLILLL
jgi:glycosyltransferase involved in cell wall biosynthesis